MVARRRSFPFSRAQPHPPRAAKAARPPQPARRKPQPPSRPLGLREPPQPRPASFTAQPQPRFQPGLVLMSPPKAGSLADRAGKARPSQLQRQRRHRARALEALAAIAVNVVLATSACYALSRLLPYQMAQQQQLREVSREMKATQQRVKVLRERLTRNFDPTQTEALLREQGWVNPRQVQVELVNPKWDQDPP